MFGKFDFRTLAIVAALVSVISCVKEEEMPADDLAQVYFELDLETTPSTRAISDGTGATQLMYGVFDEDDKLVIAKQVKNNITSLLSESGYTMGISLARGNTYRVVFWAQNPDCQAYSVSDSMKVTIDYAGINNDEVRDAFFAATEPFKVDRDVNRTVVLRRPFSQVNVGTYPYDMEHASDAGVDVAKSAATIKAVPNVINLLDGTTEGEVDVTYSLSDMPAEDLLVDVDGDGQKEVYEYLSMSYILATSETTLHEMSFNFSSADDAKTISFDDALTNVPVKRNWRTNIIGQILTGQASFQIKIDPVYEGDIIYNKGLYYNFSEDTLIKDKVFAFNAQDEWVTFTTENNNLLTFDNVTFSGKINQIAVGEYRGRGIGDVPYTNVLNKVTAKGISVANSIENVPTIDYMSILFYLRGKLSLSDCVMTGTTTIAEDVVDYNGDTQKVIAYDCGVPNFCDAEFDNCEIGYLYAWSHSIVKLTDSKVKYIRCATHNRSYEKSRMVIGAGCVVDTIVVSSTGVQYFKTVTDSNGNSKKILTADNWSPSLIIEAGATVNYLDFNGRENDPLSVKIDAGATVKHIEL